MNKSKICLVVAVLSILFLILSTVTFLVPNENIMANLNDPSLFPLVTWPMFHHDTMHTGRSLYLGAQTNGLKWSYTAGGAIASSPAIGNNGVIYFGSQDHKLYAVDSAGTLKWSFEVGDSINSSPAIGSDGTIYFGSDDKNLYAINPDGTLKWKYPTGAMIEAPPTVGNDGTVYIGSHDGKLYAINPNGNLKWSYVTGGNPSVSPAIGGDGTIYIVLSGNQELTAINPNGSLKWSYQVSEAITLTSPAIGSDGTIYLGSSDNNLYAINPNGTLKWNFTAGDSVDSSPAIGSDGTIYVGSNDHNLYAVTPNGILKWSYTTNGSVVSSPAIGNDGTIYFGSEDKNLYAVTPNGILKWSYATGACIDSSPAIGSDGIIYVGSYDNKLYAIGTCSITFSVHPSYAGTITFHYTSSYYQDGDQTTEDLGTYPVSAKPAVGFNFSRWETTGSISVTDPNSKNTTCVVSGDGTLEMVLTPIQYTIAASAGSGGAISPSGTSIVNYGDSKTFTITPSSGYKISDVKVDDTSVGAISTYTFANVTTNHTISATFAINTYTITASAGSGGAISPFGTVAVNYGSSQTFTIIPSTGYSILDIKLDGTSVKSSLTNNGDGSYSYTLSNVTANHTISATFTTNTYTITVSFGSGGTISPSGAVSVNPGDSKTFTIATDTGYKTVDVKVDGTSVGPVQTYTFTNIASDHKIEAIFGLLTYSITSSASSGGTISPLGTSNVNYGDSKTFTITPSSGYKISDVKVDGTSVGAVSTYTFSNISSDHTISASFEKQATIIILQIGNKNFTVNGETKTLDSPPVIKNSRTLLPIRTVVESLGGTVDWSDSEKKVTVSLGTNTIELWIGKSTAKVNGTDKPIDPSNPKVVPEIINSRTMLPLRFVTENLGATVDWNDKTKTITITY